MAVHPTTGFDLDQTDRLLTTTKQVRKRLDLARPVPHEELLECIDVASHAPMGGNLERNRWMIIDDADTKAKISEYFGAVGRPYLAGEHRGPRTIAARR
jgi:nitroreductase